MKVKSLSFKLTIWYTVILAIILAFGGFFSFESFKDSLMNDLERKLKKIAGDTYKIWWAKKGVTWQDAVNRAEARYKMCQPFIQVVLMPHKDRDKTGNKTWEFFHSTNISGE